MAWRCHAAAATRRRLPHPLWLGATPGEQDQAPRCTPTLAPNPRLARTHSPSAHAHLRSVLGLPSTTTMAKPSACTRHAPVMWFSLAFTSTLNRSWAFVRSPTCSRRGRQRRRAAGNGGGVVGTGGRLGGWQRQGGCVGGVGGKRRRRNETGEGGGPGREHASSPSRACRPSRQAQQAAPAGRRTL